MSHYNGPPKFYWHVDPARVLSCVSLRVAGVFSHHVRGFYLFIALFFSHVWLTCGFHLAIENIGVWFCWSRK
jgi:hypothetical protein